VGVGERTKREKQGGEKMRKVALLLAIPIIAVILSSCTFVTTRVKDSYIQKEYIDKVKVPEKYKVGTKEIKFYVDKVVDSRKTKHVWRKGWYGIPIGAPVKVNNLTETVKTITERALTATGWGVILNKENVVNPDYYINIEINQLCGKNGLLSGIIESDVLVTVKNGSSITVLRKKVEGKEYVFDIDPTMSFRMVAGQAARTLYKSLLKFFSSPEFVNAIKEDYYNTHSVKQERAE